MKVVAAHYPGNVFDLLPKLYPHVYISAEVYAEVVVAGVGLPGGANVASAGWIEVKPIQNPAELVLAEVKFGIGAANSAPSSSREN